jgi:uncharacterized membrane protein YhdT
MITKTTSVSECRFGYPLYWPDVCIKKDLLYIPAFQYLKVKIVLNDCETMI